MASVVQTFPKAVASELGGLRVFKSQVEPQEQVDAFVAPLATVVPFPNAFNPATHMQAVYRRRRIAAALLFALLVGFVLLLGNALLSTSLVTQPRAASVVTDIQPGAVYQVQPGDTLWAIVTAAHPGEDPREAIDRATRAGLSTKVEVGESIIVP